MNCAFCGQELPTNGECDLPQCRSRKEKGWVGTAKPNCKSCRMVAEADFFGPSHNGSTMCRNASYSGASANTSIASGGGSSHCTCSSCF